MTLKEFVATTDVPETVVAVFTAGTKEEANAQQSNSPMMVWNEKVANDFGDCDVARIYPSSKKRIDVWIVANPSLDSAQYKMGVLGRDYLAIASGDWERACEKNSRYEAGIAMGRIDGFIHALEISGKLTESEIQAIRKYYPDKMNASLKGEQNA